MRGWRRSPARSQPRGAALLPRFQHFHTIVPPSLFPPSLSRLRLPAFRPVLPHPLGHRLARGHDMLSRGRSASDASPLPPALFRPRPNSSGNSARMAASSCRSCSSRAVAPRRASVVVAPVNSPCILARGPKARLLKSNIPAAAGCFPFRLLHDAHAGARADARGAGGDHRLQPLEVATPPAALTPISSPTTRRISATSAAVAPPGPNPVDVFT